MLLNFENWCKAYCGTSTVSNNSSEVAFMIKKQQPVGEHP